MEPNNGQIQLPFRDDLLGGAYTNFALVSHTSEEFIIDFFMAAAPAGRHQARIITSPGHMKRMAQAVLDQIKLYESETGEKVRAAPEPKTEIGFRTSPVSNK